MFTQQIWEGITDTEYLSRYFTYLSDKMRWRHRLSTFFLLLSTSSAAASVMAQGPDWLSAVFFLVTAGLAIWSHLANYGSKASIASFISEQYADLAIEWKDLWYGGSETQDRIRELSKRFNDVTKGYDLSVDKKLNERAQNESNKILASDFGTN